MTAQLSNAQIEILQLFSTDLSENEMNILRKMLIEFRYQRLQSSLDDLNISPEILKKWEKEHLRTPYNTQNNRLAGA
jgi:hypothetical protein